MNVHKNARLTLRRRQELVTRREAGTPLKGVARSFDVSIRTARKWWTRYQAEGSAGLQDRSSRPHVSRDGAEAHGRGNLGPGPVLVPEH